MGNRATVEAMLGQVQLRRAAPQPHIQWPVWPEGVLGFDFEPELGIGGMVRRATVRTDAAGGRVKLAPKRDSNARPTA